MGWSGAFPDRNFKPEELTLARLGFLEREGKERQGRPAPPRIRLWDFGTHLAWVFCSCFFGLGIPWWSVTPCVVHSVCSFLLFSALLSLVLFSSPPFPFLSFPFVSFPFPLVFVFFFCGWFLRLLSSFSFSADRLPGIAS